LGESPELSGKYFEGGSDLSRKVETPYINADAARLPPCRVRLDKHYKKGP